MPQPTLAWPPLMALEMYIVTVLTAARACSPKKKKKKCQPHRPENLMSHSKKRPAGHIS